MVPEKMSALERSERILRFISRHKQALAKGRGDSGIARKALRIIRYLGPNYSQHSLGCTKSSPQLGCNCGLEFAIQYLDGIKSST
ncbi:MAG TPA: hypothetical protein VJC12_00245 [Candidatus Paceibacterota bacterium]